MGVHCWWCCHTFETEPWHLPYKHDRIRDEFLALGYFCSLPCMKAYVLDKHGNSKKGNDMLSNMLLMRKRLCPELNKSQLHVKCAPNKYTLDIFGGNYNIAEFRKLSTDVVDVHIPSERVILKDVIVADVKKVDAVAPTERQLSNKLSSITNSKAVVETLKLKRPTPLKRNANNLENIMGITRNVSSVDNNS